MANLVYKRVSTDQQSTARQNLVLDEAGIEDPVVFEEDPGTSSRLHPLQRPKFRELLTYARPGDTLHISEMFRLVRGTGHILDVLDVLHRDQVALRIHDGAFSAMDLTARHPRTGELLSTVKFMVQTLAAAGELQRDLQRELTYGGLRAAEAKGSKGGRRPAVAATKTDDVRTAYLEGRSIAALARDHRVSRGAIRTAVADLLPDHTANKEDAPAASPAPGAAADPAGRLTHTHQVRTPQHLADRIEHPTRNSRAATWRRPRRCHQPDPSSVTASSPTPISEGPVRSAPTKPRARATHPDDDLSGYHPSPSLDHPGAPFHCRLPRSSR
ncbi:recombinase family protein [Streptomyces sp. NPDC059816]|uniref:recombinase family protein n=2 Tax=Streptomyces TaxID=1883 RepID=UPI003649F9BA